jgi:hypothetical protein
LSLNFLVCGAAFDLTLTQHARNMSFARGERVYFDLDSGIGDIVHPEHDTAPPSVSSAFVGDILERNTGAANPPTAPILKPNVNGFPAHKKRTPKTSAFKQRRAVQEQAMQANQPPEAPRRSATADEEKRQIDEENRQKLAGMSTEEIAQEREELFSSLPASLIQKFLGRANLDEGSNERDLGLDLPTPIAKATDDDRKPELTTTSAKKVSFATPDTIETLTRPPPEASEPTPPTLSKAPTVVEPTITTDTKPSDSFHFPNPTQPPDLDPSDPAFLENLHTKYFPNLAYDPSSLSWMAPIDPDDKKSPYHPSQTAYNASDLRFDFKGNLLAPSVARELPVTKGLHHHADAPEAAGYTIPELAVMARSAVPAQRCVAFQTLGRFLYRLGRGEFGFEKVRQRADGPVQIAKNPMAEEEEVDEDDIEVDMEDAGSQMAAGLWACVEEGRVVETLTEEAKRKSGHLSSITFAQEAVWNFQRGGGRKRQAI